jgi:hypothetical protein
MSKIGLYKQKTLCRCDHIVTLKIVTEPAQPAHRDLSESVEIITKKKIEGAFLLFTVFFLRRFESSAP